MTAYIGPVGGLVPLKCPASLNLDVTRAQSLVTTTGGRRVAFQAPRAHRSWSVDTSAATPAEVTAVQALEGGMYGPGPWAWVDPWAQVTNVLTPEITLFHPGKFWGGGGASVSTAPVDLGGGNIVRRSLLIGDPAQELALNGLTTGAYTRTPVIPGEPITVSLYGAAATTGAWLRVNFRDAADTSMTLHYAYPTHPLGQIGRVSVTLTPPAGAASVRLTATGFSRITGTQLTWTKQLTAWSVGQGAEKVIIDGVGAAALRAVRHMPSQQLGANSFQIIEVG